MKNCISDDSENRILVYTRTIELSDSTKIGQMFICILNTPPSLNAFYRVLDSISRSSNIGKHQVIFIEFQTFWERFVLVGHSIMNNSMNTQKRGRGT